MSENIVSYIVRKKKISQADIARELAVSRAQVSKWKAGECISDDKKEKLNRLAGLFGDDSRWAILMKSEKRAKQWIEYVSHIQDMVPAVWESQEELKSQAVDILLLLNEFDVELSEAPPELINEECEEESVLEKTLATVISYSNIYIKWLLHFMDFSYLDDYELWGIKDQLEVYTALFSVEYLDGYIKKELGINQETLHQRLIDSKREAKSLISSLYEKLNAKGVSYTIDYFAFTTEHPEVLCDYLMLHRDYIKPHLSYGQQLILSHTSEVSRRLEAIDLKLCKIEGLLQTSS